jgi:hypothetical protein
MLPRSGRIRPPVLWPQRSSYFRYLSRGHRWDHNTPMASATTYALQSSTINAIAPGRVRFIEHQGKRILFINYSHCDVAMLKAVAEEGHRVIAQEPPNTVLTLNDVTGTSFDKESIAVLQAKVAANAPYVRKAAVIGISGLQRLIYEGVQAFTRRRLPLFESRREALAWLAQD